MELETRKDGNITVLTIHGDIDFNSSPDVRRSLLDLVDGAEGIVVDMAGVEYIDSSGVASLIEAYQSAKSADCAFSLASVSKSALRVLKLAHLEKVFVIHDSVEKALG